MIDFFKSVKWGMLFMSIVTIAGGVMIAMNPANSVELIIRVVGGILMAGGVLSILGYVLDRKSGLSGFFDIILGAAMLLVGLALFIRPQAFEKFVHIIFAIILGVHGLNMLVEAFRGIKYKDKKLLTTILMALICIGLAVLVYFKPFTTANTLMFVVGIALILDGLLLFVVSIRRGVVIHKFHVMEREAAEELAAAEAEAAAMEERIAERAAQLAAQNPTYGRPWEETKPREEAKLPNPSIADDINRTDVSYGSAKTGSATREEKTEKDFAATFEEIEEAIKAEEAKLAELGKTAEQGMTAEAAVSAEAPKEEVSAIKSEDGAAIGDAGAVGTADAAGTSGAAGVAGAAGTSGAAGAADAAGTGSAGNSSDEVFDAPKEEKKSFIKRFFDQE